jgi:hypothetical protein
MHTYIRTYYNMHTYIRTYIRTYTHKHKHKHKHKTHIDITQGHIFAHIIKYTWRIHLLSAHKHKHKHKQKKHINIAQGHIFAVLSLHTVHTWRIQLLSLQDVNTNTNTHRQITRTHLCTYNYHTYSTYLENLATIPARCGCDAACSKNWASRSPRPPAWSFL